MGSQRDGILEGWDFRVLEGWDFRWALGLAGYHPLTPSVEEVISLLDYGADVNACDNMGYTPLFYAAIANKVDNLDVLINAGADIKRTYVICIIVFIQSDSCPLYCEK